MIHVFAVWLAACGRPAVEPETSATPAVPAAAAPVVASQPAESASDPAWTPTESQAAMLKLLSLRDGPAPCAEVEKLSTDAVADLTAIVDHATMPPAAPMAAAGCLVTGHAEAAEPSITRWMTDPRTKGLAILAAGHLDAMPKPVAVRVVGVALAGPYAEDVRKRVIEAADPEIKALGEAPHAP